MHKISLIVILLFSHILAQQWIWQNPLPQGASMFTVIPLSEEQAIITGSRGTIITTEDCGRSWQVQKLSHIGAIRKYSFISKEEGWIIGSWTDITAYYDTNKTINFSKIFKTNDGGFTWQELSPEIEIDFTIYSFNDIEFIDNQTGFLLAVPLYADINEEDQYPGLIYKTEDGGYNWTQINIGIDRKYYQIIYTDELTGYLLSQPYYSNFDFDSNLLHKTIDGGDTWTTFADSGFGVINFINNQIGWSGNYRTTDGGKTWQYHEFNFPPSINNISKITFTDSIVGYALNDYTILKTIDCGNTWIEQIETQNGLLQDIKFYNSLNGYACGYGGVIYITNDGGENWSRHGEGVTTNLEDIYFIDENFGWTVGYDGTILNTENSGEIWGKQTLPAECDTVIFSGVDFIDKNKGWIAGGNYILNTENSGNDWHIQLKAELENGLFRDIKFIDDKNGFAVGQKGTLYGYGIIYRTFDGGKVWQRTDNGDLPKLDKIFFFDEDQGWIVGWGILLSTHDGGVNWQKEYFSERLKYIQFTDLEHGWISAGDEGAFYRTTDGGENWEFVPFSKRYLQSFSSFYFFNNSQGIATGFLFPNILTTEDGGINWTYQERLSTVRVNATTFVNDNLGWAVGYDGNIMKFEGSYFTVTAVENDNNMNQTQLPVGNYPNPFNNVTKIHFNLSHSQEVKISIYNILGKLVEYFSLSNTIKGSNIIDWQPKNIGSGLYLVKINCMEYTKTFKSLYLK